MNYGCRDVVEEFFRCHPGVGFVQIISVKADCPTMSKPNRPRVVSTLYANTKATPLLLHELSRIHEKLPDPEATPCSAYHPHWRSCGRSFAGGWEFNGNIRISVRMLQELLAGRITSAEFLVFCF